MSDNRFIKYSISTRIKQSCQVSAEVQAEIPEEV